MTVYAQVQKRAEKRKREDESGLTRLKELMGVEDGESEEGTGSSESEDSDDEEEQEGDGGDDDVEDDDQPSEDGEEDELELASGSELLGKLL